jgi:hypothetical protein
MNAKSNPKASHGGPRPGAGRPRKLPPAPPKNVDPDSVNPRAVLASIAVDVNAPATARVAAARALLSAEKTAERPGVSGAPIDPLSRRAIELMARKGRAN